MSERPIVLAAGGTGGHVFPAQALAAELVARRQKVILVTDRRGQGYEEKFPGCEIVNVRAATPAGRSAFGRVIAFGEIAAGTWAACSAFRRIKPALVIGFGGYPSLPAMFAARHLRIPTALHEQNAVLGRVNRLMVRRVDAVACAFPETVGLDDFSRRHAHVTGNPVRTGILSLRDLPYVAPKIDGPLRLLILGGSQGARILSEAVPAAFGLLAPELKARLRITQQCRPEDIEQVRQTYAASGITADLATFFEDVPALLGAAHLCITRAGASTIAELTVAGRPAILVPYKYATDDHQAANARHLTAIGAGWMIAQDELTGLSLSAMLTSLLTQPEALARAAEATRKFGQPHAVTALADLAIRLSHGKLEQRVAA